MITETKNNKAFINTKIPSDWQIVELNKCCDFITKGATPTTYGFEWTNNGVVFLRSECVSERGLELKAAMFISDEADRIMKRSSLHEGDILMTITGNVGRVCQIPKGFPKANINQHIARIRVRNDYSEKDYIFQYLKQEKIAKDYLKITTGQAYPQISLEQVRNTSIPLPPLPEQKAIAQVLSTADAALHTTEKLIAQKELRKKWLMQQLLIGKKRLKGFEGEVKLKLVEQYLKEISERNKELKVSNVLSVTNSKGFINQADQFDRVVASEDATNYKIVRKGQFAYNPSRVNVGSLDLLRCFESGILSPMYVVFETDKSQLLPDYFYYQLKTQWFYGHIPMFVQGSVRDSLSFDGLCSMKFFIPSIEEQTAIAQVLQAADKEISLLKAKAEKLRKQKKGLMQVLLTGKVRLKINNMI